MLAGGNLHVANVGTGRDPDGRLCWGVDDFDEADELPYTNDLVRLAASARVARKAGLLVIDGRTAVTGSCDVTRRAEHGNAGNLLVLRAHPGLAARYR